MPPPKDFQNINFQTLWQSSNPFAFGAKRSTKTTAYVSKLVHQNGKLGGGMNGGQGRTDGMESRLRGWMKSASSTKGWANGRMGIVDE